MAAVQMQWMAALHPLCSPARTAWYIENTIYSRGSLMGTGRSKWTHEVQVECSACFTAWHSCTIRVADLLLYKPGLRATFPDVLIAMKGCVCD